MRVHSFNLKLCTRWIQVRTEYWKEHLVEVLLWSRALLCYFCQSFYLHRFRLQVLLPMDTHTSCRRALKLAQEQEVAEDWRRPRNESQSSTCCSNFETKERESKGKDDVLGTLLKLLVKNKLLHNGKVPLNAELRPLRGEKRGTEVQRYATLNEAMEILRDNL